MLRDTQKVFHVGDRMGWSLLQVVGPWTMAKEQAHGEGDQTSSARTSVQCLLESIHQCWIVCFVVFW